MINATSECTVRVRSKDRRNATTATNLHTETTDVTCNLKPACFSTDRDLLPVLTSSSSDPLNVSNAEGKVMIVLSKCFRRLLNSFDAVFRRETSTALQRKSQKRISSHI